MSDNFDTYKDTKQTISDRKISGMIPDSDDLDDFFEADSEHDENRVNMTDIMQVGSKVIIGGGLGLLGGIAAIAVVASAAEVVIAGTVSKIAGAVGGAVGLTMGLNGLSGKNGKRK